MAVKLPPLVQSIVLDPTGVRQGAPQITKAFGDVHKKTTDATRAIKKMDGGLYSLSFRAQTTGRRMMKSLGLPILAATGIAVASFAKFETAMVKIEGLVGVSTAGVERFGEAVKNAAKQTGRGPQELAEAMFFIASAGLRGADAMEVLNASAKGAAIGLGQTKSIADAATSAVNAYGAENLSGGGAVDVLTAAVREGKVEAERLAPAIGKAIPVASAMGIEFHEVAAAIAAMTRTGTDARTSAIQLRQIMQSILDPSRQTEKALREMGIAQGELADQAREKGLLFVLKRLRDLAQENEEAFADVFPNVRALAGALDITGENLAENEQIFAALASSTGDTDKAFALVENTVSFKFNKAMSNLKVQLLETGDAFSGIINIFTAVMSGITKFIKLLSSIPLGSIIIAIGLLTFTVGAGLVVWGSMTQAVLFAKQALDAYTMSASRAAVATGAATAAGKAGLVSNLAKLGMAGLAVGAAIGVAAIGIAIFGRKSESSAEKTEKLRKELADIKSLADLSISSLDAYALAIDGVADSMGVLPDIVQSFQSQMLETIADMREASGREGEGIGLADTLLLFFTGKPNDAKTKKQFDDLFDYFESQYSDSFNEDSFQRLFGMTDQDKIFEAILGIGPDGPSYSLKRQVAFSVHALKDTLVDELGGLDIDEVVNNILIQDIGDTTDGGIVGAFIKKILGGDVMGHGDKSIDANEFYRALKDVVSKGDPLPKALNQVAQDMIDSMRSEGGFSVIADVYGALIGEIAAVTGFEGAELEGALAIFDQALMTQLADLDNFNQDMDDEISKYANIVDYFIAVNAKYLEGILGDDDNAGGTDDAFSSAFDTDNVKDVVKGLELQAGFGKVVAEVFQELNEMGNPLQQIFQESGLEENVFILEETVRRLRDIDEAAEDAARPLRTVEEVFEDLAVAVSTAKAEADQFKKRFDALTGSLFEIARGRSDLIGSFQSLANAVRDSGGSFDEVTAKGRAAKDAILDVVEGAASFAQAGVAAGEMTRAQGAQFIQEQIDNLVKTAKLHGAAEQDIMDIIASLGLDGTRILSLIAAPDKAQTESQSFNEHLDALEQGIIGFLDFGTLRHVGAQAMAGTAQGMLDMMPYLEDTAGLIKASVERAFKIAFRITSPSVLMAEEIGRPITAGIAKGILDDRGKIRWTVKELVNDTISEASMQIDSVVNAITSNMKLSKAKVALDKAMRDFGSEGQITKRESLNRKQLERDLADAERALRLGQGHQEDLDLALLDAQEALADFDANVTSGAPVTEAQLGVMQAGFEMANAVAVMKMEGDKAIELFKNLGETMGIPMEDINRSLDTASDHIDVYTNMFDDDTLHAIDMAHKTFLKIEDSTKNIGDAAIGFDLDNFFSGDPYDWEDGEPFSGGPSKWSEGIGRWLGWEPSQLNTSLGRMSQNQIRTDWQGVDLQTYWGEQSRLQLALDQIATNTGSADYGGYESGRTPGGGRPVKTNTGSGYKGMDFTSTDPADYAGWVGISGGY